MTEVSPAEAGRNTMGTIGDDLKDKTINFKAASIASCTFTRNQMK